MNKKLHALMLKLNWQLNMLSQQLQTLNEQQSALDKQLTQTQEALNQACTIPAVIHPEQEIARLNFLIRQQQQYDELTSKYKEMQKQEGLLKTQQSRLSKELKMLEKYQEKQQQLAKQQAIVQQQNSNDEWILQRRNQHEN